jgi:hypothetical protein
MQLFLEMYSASQSHYAGDLDYHEVFHCDENIKPTKIIFYSTLSPPNLHLHTSNVHNIRLVGINGNISPYYY